MFVAEEARLPSSKQLFEECKKFSLIWIRPWYIRGIPRGRGLYDRAQCGCISPSGRRALRRRRDIIRYVTAVEEKGR